jgi:leucyl aminopeptidase
MSNPTVSGYDPVPSLGKRSTVTVRDDMPPAGEVGALAVPVVSGEDPPDELGVGAEALAAAGFTGARGQTLVLPNPDGMVRSAWALEEWSTPPSSATSSPSSRVRFPIT